MNETEDEAVTFNDGQLGGRGATLSANLPGCLTGSHRMRADDDGIWRCIRDLLEDRPVTCTHARTPHPPLPSRRRTS